MASMVASALGDGGRVEHAGEVVDGLAVDRVGERRARRRRVGGWPGVAGDRPGPRAASRASDLADDLGQPDDDGRVEVAALQLRGRSGSRIACSSSGSIHWLRAGPTASPTSPTLAVRCQVGEQHEAGLVLAADAPRLEQGLRARPSVAAGSMAARVLALGEDDDLDAAPARPRPRRCRSALMRVLGSRASAVS